MTKKQLSKFVNQIAKKGITELKAELKFAKEELKDAKAELKDDMARVKWEKVYVDILEKELKKLKPK